MLGQRVGMVVIHGPAGGIMLKQFEERWSFGCSSVLLICFALAMAFASVALCVGVLMMIASAIFGEFTNETWKEAFIVGAIAVGPFFFALPMQHLPGPGYKVKDTLDLPY
jgi:hypothetical protein